MVAIIVNIGMWLERFIIVVTSLQRDYLPSSWGNYRPTVWDWSTFVGTIGLFLTLLFLFVRFLPMISIAEMRAILPEARVDVDEDLQGDMKIWSSGHLVIWSLIEQFENDQINDQINDQMTK